jgi:hypothetical protein
MSHPLTAIAMEKRWPLFVLLLISTLVVMAVLQATGAPLRTEAAPQGIISFELTGTVADAREIIDSWDASARAHAGFNLGFDYVLLVFYSTTIAYACAWIASVCNAAAHNTVRNNASASLSRTGTPGAKLKTLVAAGLLLAWGQWLAALLDAVENAALLVNLLDAPVAPWPQVAQWCAAIKFGLVLLGLAYTLLGAIWAAAKVLQRKQ